MSRRSVAVLALFAFAACAPSQTEQDANLSSTAAAIVNGQPHDGHPAIGKIIATTPRGPTTCTGTVIAQGLVLTAGHCLDGAQDMTFQVTQGSQTTTTRIAQAERNPSFRIVNGLADPGHDLAILALERPWPNVTPMQVSAQEPVAAERVTLIGYGMTGPDKYDQGTKRITNSQVLEVRPTHLVVQAANGSDGSVCFGDSGGPLIATRDGEEVIVGIVSGGPDQSCTKSFHTRTDVHSSWIAQLGTNASGLNFRGSVDRQVPTIEPVFPAPTMTVAPRFVVALRADEAPHHIEWFVDGKFVGVAQPARESDGSVVWTVDLRQSVSTINVLGRHLFTVVAMDASGNAAAFRSDLQIVPTTVEDLQPPTIMQMSLTDGDSIETPVPLTVDVRDNYGVSLLRVSVDGVPVLAQFGNQPLSIPMTPGQRTITVTAYDFAGNRVSADLALRVQSPDTVPPELTVTNPRDASALTTRFSVRAKASDNRKLIAVRITVDGQNERTRNAAPFDFPVNADPGKRVITVSAEDRSGNVTEEVRTVYVVDPGEREVAVAWPTMGQVLNERRTSVHVWVKRDLPVRELQLFRNGEFVASIDEAPWAFEDVELPLGENTLRVDAMLEDGESPVSDDVNVERRDPAANGSANDAAQEGGCAISANHASDGSRTAVVYLLLVWVALGRRRKPGYSTRQLGESSLHCSRRNS